MSPDSRIALAEEIEALMVEAYPTPWIERPQEYDDWGWLRTSEPDEDGFYHVACVARGNDDEAEENLARADRRQPKQLGANSALIAKVFGSLPTILAALRADAGSDGAVASLPKVEFHQQDWIPGFAAFLPSATTPQPDSRAFCVLNLGALLGTVATGAMPASDLPATIADSMMHEVIHVIEQWAGAEFGEERVDGLIEQYRASQEGSGC